MVLCHLVGGTPSCIYKSRKRLCHGNEIQSMTHFTRIPLNPMPINLRIFTTPSDKNVILSKKLARKGDIFMNLSIQDELQLFSEELYRHLTPSLLEELAKELGFVKRKRKFSGNELATICIWVSQRTASDSLVRLCSQLHAATGTLMSPEGLNKRFDKKRLNF